MKEFFNFGDAEVEVKPFNKKFGQLEEGFKGDVKYSSTLTQLTVSRGRNSVTVGFKNAKDFDFDVLWKFATSELKAKEKARA